jgi:hypothetical protein
MKLYQLKSNIFFPFIMYTLIFLLCGCSQENEALRRMERFVPANTLCYVHIGCPDTFFESIDLFFEPLGGLPLMGQIPIKDFIQITVESTTPLRFEGFDFTKPWGCALLPTGGEYFDINIEVYIPLTDPGKYYKRIEEYITKLGKLYSRKSGSYIIVSTAKKPEKKFLPEETLDLKDLALYEIDSVSCYVNTEDLFKGIRTLMEISKENIFDSQKLQNEFTESFNKQMAFDIIDTVAGVLEQVEHYSFNLHVDSKGITSRSLAAFTKGGSIDELNSKIKPLKGLKSFADRIPSRWFFSVAYNLNEEFLSAFMEKYSSFLFSILDIEEASGKIFEEYLVTYVRSAGTTLSMGFDVDLDVSNISDLSTERLLYSKGAADDLSVFSEMFPRLMTAHTLVCMGVKDKGALRTSMERMMAGPVIKDIFDTVFKMAGISLSVSYKKDMSSNGFPYDEIQYGVSYSTSASGGGKIKSSSKMNTYLGTMLKDFFERHPVLLHWGEEEFYMVLGRDALPLLKAVAEKKKYTQESLLETEVFRRFAEKMPDDAQLMGHLSLKRLFHLASCIPFIGTKIAEMEGEPGILWYMRYHNERWETMWFWDIEEISIFYAQFNSLMGAIF